MAGRGSEVTRPRSSRPEGNRARRAAGKLQASFAGIRDARFSTFGKHQALCVISVAPGGKSAVTCKILRKIESTYKIRFHPCRSVGTQRPATREMEKRSRRLRFDA